MKKKLPVALLLFSAAFLIPLMFGCGQRGNIDQEKSDLQGRINATLDSVNQRFDAYQAAMADTTIPPAAHAEMSNQITALQDMRTDLTSRADSLNAVSQENWPAFRDETGQVIDQYQQRLQAIPERPTMPGSPGSGTGNQG